MFRRRKICIIHHKTAQNTAINKSADYRQTARQFTLVGYVLSDRPRRDVAQVGGGGGGGSTKRLLKKVLTDSIVDMIRLRSETIRLANRLSDPFGVARRPASGTAAGGAAHDNRSHAHGAAIG